LKPKLLTILAAALVLAASANAETVLITSPGALAADTIVDWGTLGGAYSAVTSPFTVNMPLMSINVSEPGGNFERRDQDAAGHYTGGFSGHFAVGTHLLWTKDSLEDESHVFGYGPITFDFGAPISGFLVQMESAGWTPDYFLQAFSGDADLGTFQISQTFPPVGCCDNTAPFIGVLSDQANITRIVVSTGEDFLGNWENDFAIGGPLIQTQGGPSAPTVPEPSSLVLFGANILVLTTLALRRRRG
jgi:hypothetical protein